MTGAAWLTLLFLAARPSVTSGSDCPSGRDVEGRVSVLLPERTALPGTATVLVTEEGLLVELKPENPVFAAQRTVMVGRSCEQRAEAAAVIIATWWPTEPNGSVPGADRESDRGKSVRSFSMSAGGYASIVSGSVAPGARAEAGLVFRETRFGARLAVGGTFPHEGSLDQGRVSWSRVSLELGPTYALRFVRFDAGVVGSMVWTQGSGFSEDRKESGLAVGGTFGVRAALPWGRVLPWLEVRGLVWPRTQRMYVNDSASGLRSDRSLPQAELQLGAGVAVDLF